MSQSLQTINPLVIIGGSLSFISSLAWNDAIQTGIKEYYGELDNGVRVKFIYAVIITILIVLFAIFLKYVNDKAIEIQNIAINYNQNRTLSNQYSQS